MKEMMGLMVATTLGIAAATLNWFYLERRGSDIQMVEFLGIASDARIAAGDTFQSEHFTSVRIPTSSTHSLRHFSVLYADRHTVLGMPATRPYQGGDLIMRQDLKAPPLQLELNDDNARVMWIPVDPRTFVSSLVSPGDQVSFLLPSGREGQAELANPADASTDRAEGGPETIGPFLVLSLGTRLGRTEVLRGSGGSRTQENVLAVRVVVENGRLEPRARRLWESLQRSGVRQVGVLLHPQAARHG